MSGEYGELLSMTTLSWSSGTFEIQKDTIPGASGARDRCYVDVIYVK